jgi:hypothetical protein
MAGRGRGRDLTLPAWMKGGQVSAPTEKPLPGGALLDDNPQAFQSLKAFDPRIPGGALSPSPFPAAQFQQHPHGLPFSGLHHPYSQPNQFQPPGSYQQEQIGPPFQQTSSMPPSSPEHFPAKGPGGGLLPPRPITQALNSRPLSENQQVVPFTTNHVPQQSNLQFPFSPNSPLQPPFPRGPFTPSQQYPPLQQFPFPPNHPRGPPAPSSQSPPQTAHGGLPPPPFPIPQGRLHGGQFQPQQSHFQHDPSAGVLVPDMQSGLPHLERSEGDEAGHPYSEMSGSTNTHPLQFQSGGQVHPHENMPPLHMMQGGGPLPFWGQGRPPPHMQMPPYMQSQLPWQSGFMPQGRLPQENLQESLPFEKEQQQQQHQPQQRAHGSPVDLQQSHINTDVPHEKSGDLEASEVQQPRKRKSRWDPISEEKESVASLAHQNGDLSSMKAAGAPPHSQNSWNLGPNSELGRNGHSLSGLQFDNQSGPGMAITAAVQEAVLREQEASAHEIIAQQRQEKRPFHTMEMSEQDIMSARHDPGALKEKLVKMTSDYRMDMANKRGRPVQHEQENVEIGNGYGVPGGRAYFSGPRPPMFTLPAAHMYKQENNFSPSNSMLEGVASGCAQGSVDPAQGLQRPLDGSGFFGKRTSRFLTSGLGGGKGSRKWPCVFL